jgi:hypothetical protein
MSSHRGQLLREKSMNFNGAPVCSVPVNTADYGMKKTGKAGVKPR